MLNPKPLSPKPSHLAVVPQLPHWLGNPSVSLGFSVQGCRTWKPDGDESYLEGQGNLVTKNDWGHYVAQRASK